MRSRVARVVAVAAVVAGTVGGTASMASASPSDGTGHKVTICHATASKTNPYVVITVDVASIIGDSGHGNSGVNEGDIIPTFDYTGYHYPGHNLQLLNTPASAGCYLPCPPPDNGGDSGNF